MYNQDFDLTSIETMFKNANKNKDRLYIENLYSPLNALFKILILFLFDFIYRICIKGNYLNKKNKWITLYLYTFLF